MHAISSYRGKPQTRIQTYTATNKQTDQLEYMHAPQLRWRAL